MTAFSPNSPAKPPRKSLCFYLWILAALIAVVGGTWFYLKYAASKKQERETQITQIEIQSNLLLENRRWAEAETELAKLDKLSAGSQFLVESRQRIDQGKLEEQNQFIGYNIGQATAELEAGRFEEAAAAVQRVLEKFPEEEEARSLINQIAGAREKQSRAAALAAASELMNQRKWQLAIQAAEKILANSPEDIDALALLSSAKTAIEKAALDQKKATELLKMAGARDKGQFDQQALDWLREAKALAPDDAAITALLEKYSSYTRTLRVPGDFATPAEALAAARDRDRIILAAQTWPGPLVINKAIELIGSGPETKVECPAEAGSAITISTAAKGVRVSGISFRHTHFDAGKERFSAAQVRGGSVTFSDCRFTEASGNGLVVIEGGQAVISRCRFFENGWNGAAVIGKGSLLDVRDSEAVANFEHGFESWDGAAATFIGNRCEGNTRNGIHIDNGASSAVIEGNQLVANREYGAVISSAGGGKISKNIVRTNQLGGMVIRAKSSAVPIALNEITLNSGPGLILEKGLPSAAYANNPISKNAGQQTLVNADLSAPPQENPAPAPSSR